MDTTVVFFPGMGYGADRPLFYYARKQAQQTGSEVVCVDYPSFSPDPSVPAPLQAQAALPGCVNDALAQLAGRCLGRCVFVSKSLGTLVAGEVARRLALRPVQIYLTPLPRTYDAYMRGRSCWAVYGDADPLMTPDCAARMEQDPAVRLTKIPGANHSLEVPGDIVASVDALRQVAQLYRAVL